MKTWLEQHIGRPVAEKIEAHSGAVIETEGMEDTSESVDGEVNVARPTIVNQLERAQRYYVSEQLKTMFPALSSK